jgi:DNA mismatch repair protein MutS2
VAHGLNYLNENTFRTLEFERIRVALTGAAGSAEGRARVAALLPSTNVAAVRSALDRTSQGVRLLRALGGQPYHDLPDVAETLTAARVDGLHLEPLALGGLASFIEGALEIARAVAAFEPAPDLSRLAGGVRDTSEVASAIRRAILPSGEVADDASTKLSQTRRSIVRLKAQLQSVMESYLRGKDADRLLQDKLVTTRNDRYVLLLKAEQRGQIPGIIHGSSGSGASLFVEPLPAVDLNNDIVSLTDEERREVVRILRELTSRVAARGDDLARTAAILGELDAVQAMARLAVELDAHPPEMVEDLSLELLDARHPLLMPRLCERLGVPRRSSREPVPVSLRVGGGEPALIISGPNTGGKTVALKTVGLLALMAQCGLHVPAAPGSRLPVFRRIFADIGDEQSIAANLSTFSAHLAAIVEMTRELAAPALVLLDEVGAGTDPTEGGALGVAIVDHFRERGAMVVATTHHGLMKAYAQATAGVSCASFGYDPESYEPTYRLTLGAPGRSLALEMAERLGLPAEVVADARARRDTKQAQAEDLLKKLEEQETLLGREVERLAAERSAFEQDRERLAAAERELADRKRATVEAFARDLRKKSEEAARRAADAIREAVQKVEASRRAVDKAAAQARTEAVQAIGRAQDEALADAAADLPPEAEAVAPGPLAPGDRVRVRELSVVGELLSLHEEEAEVAVSGKRLRVPRASLLRLDAGPPAPARAASAWTQQPSAGHGVKSHGHVPAEINLVGLTVDEALPRIDKLLDDASLSERRQIRVIHGFGQGTLRRAVAGLLNGHPHVAAYHLAAANEGGGGVTIVELKE